MFRRFARPAVLMATCALSLLHGATPVSYTLEATVAAEPSAGREPFGTKFFFTTGNQVIYRVVPADRSDTDPATRWEFWSPTATAAVLPVTGYESLDVVGLNPDGIAVGRSVSESAPGPNPHQEAALYWTSGGGSIIPEGFDAGSSGLKTINAAGQTVGFTDSGNYQFVRWTAAAPSALDGVTLPIGYPFGEIHGVSATGEVLFYVTDSEGNPRVAVWEGTGSTIVGPAPEVGETFYPSNCVMNGVGDVAMLLFTVNGTYRIIFVPAADRTTYQIFTFPGPVTGAYTLQISDAGVVSCQTSANEVSIVSSPRAQQRTFSGYSPAVNAPGAFIFGSQGIFYYWDAAAWVGNPVAVPLVVPAAPSAPTVVGFNDDGRLLTLSDNANRTVRTLAILAPTGPAPAPPANVRVTPVRNTLRANAGDRVNQRLVRPHITGSPTNVRYVLRGKPPAGTNFRTSDGRLRGRLKRPQQKNLRVFATYSADGSRQQSAAVKIRLRVNAPANRPPQ